MHTNNRNRLFRQFVDKFDVIFEYAKTAGFKYSASSIADFCNMFTVSRKPFTLETRISFGRCGFQCTVL